MNTLTATRLTQFRTVQDVTAEGLSVWDFTNAGTSNEIPTHRISPDRTDLVTSIRFVRMGTAYTAHVQGLPTQEFLDAVSRTTDVSGLPLPNLTFRTTTWGKEQVQLGGTWRPISDSGLPLRFKPTN